MVKAVVVRFLLLKNVVHGVGILLWCCLEISIDLTTQLLVVVDSPESVEGEREGEVVVRGQAVHSVALITTGSILSVAALVGGLWLANLSDRVRMLIR